MKTLSREKSRGGGGPSLQFSDYRNFRGCIQIRIRIQSSSSLEEEVYVYFTELLALRQMSTSKILVIARFAHVDSFVTVMITCASLLGLHAGKSSLSITARAEGYYTLCGGGR